MAQSTFSIQYHVMLGDPRLMEVKGATSSFTFDAQAPSVLSGKVPEQGDPNQAEYMDALSRYMLSLAKAHTKDLLLAHPSKCTICPRPATSTVNCSIPNLAPQPGRGPSIFAFELPVCILAGICYDKASKIAKEVITSKLPAEVKVNNTSPGCQTCGAAKGPLKLCAACKSISYCSKECQAKNWGFHKSLCKIIRMERAMNDATGGIPMEKLSLAEFDRVMQVGREAGGIPKTRKSYGEIERDLQAMMPSGMKLKMMTTDEATAAGYTVNKKGTDEGAKTKA